MRRWIYLTGLIAAIAFAGCDDEDDDDNNNDMTDDSISAVDSTFMVKAALSNITEVDFGGIAATKGTDSLVRAFGQMMVTEHTTAQDELEQIADEYDMTLPDTLDMQHRQIREQLMALTGYQFDSLYITTQVMDHTMTLENFETERTNGDEDNVRAYADKYQPHIEHHLELADSIHMVVVEGQHDDEGGDMTDGEGDDSGGDTTN